jgi:hypothetical protein
MIEKPSTRFLSFAFFGLMTAAILYPSIVSASDPYQTTEIKEVVFGSAKYIPFDPYQERMSCAELQARGHRIYCPESGKKPLVKPVVSKPSRPSCAEMHAQGLKIGCTESGEKPLVNRVISKPSRPSCAEMHAQGLKIGCTESGEKRLDGIAVSAAWAPSEGYIPFYTRSRDGQLITNPAVENALKTEVVPTHVDLSYNEMFSEAVTANKIRPIQITK